MAKSPPVILELPGRVLVRGAIVSGPWDTWYPGVITTTHRRGGREVLNLVQALCNPPSSDLRRVQSEPPGDLKVARGSRDIWRVSLGMTTRGSQVTLVP